MLHDTAMNDEACTTLEALALAMVQGGKATKAQVQKLLKSDSGENGLTCEQALGAHCSQKCTQGALKLLKKIK